MTEWWYNHVTGEVEEGPQSLATDRDGPFATKEDAARAPRDHRGTRAQVGAGGSIRLGQFLVLT